MKFCCVVELIKLYNVSTFHQILFSGLIYGWSLFRVKKTSVEPVVWPYKTSYFYTKKSKFKHFVVKSAWENVIKVPAEGFTLQVFPQFFPERENCYVGALCLCGRYKQRIRRRWAFNTVPLQSVKTCWFQKVFPLHKGDFFNLNNFKLLNI